MTALTPITCQSLRKKYMASSVAYNPACIVFSGVGNKDVYNITAPFEVKGETVIAGRVEARDSEHSHVMFFHETDTVWTPIENTPVLELQDPFVSFIHGQLVIGGVEIFPHPVNPGALGWRTVFYKGGSLDQLNPFAKGPDGMKDIRLVELENSRIGVFTRPQGEKGGRGRIGYTEISKLEELEPSVIDEAPLLDLPFHEDEWGGVNELHLLSEGEVGALGHIACFDEKGDRHYYAISFVFHPDTRACTRLKMIAQRSDFLDSPAKRPDLQDVVFSGGLVRKNDGTARLYAGVADASAQYIYLNDPFKPQSNEEL